MKRRPIADVRAVRMPHPAAGTATLLADGCGPDQADDGARESQHAAHDRERQALGVERHAPGAADEQEHGQDQAAGTAAGAEHEDRAPHGGLRRGRRPPPVRPCAWSIRRAHVTISYRVYDKSVQTARRPVQESAT